MRGKSALRRLVNLATSLLILYLGLLAAELVELWYGHPLAASAFVSLMLVLVLLAVRELFM